MQRFWGRQATTQRTNFDRALASVVSYYEEKPPEKLSDAKVFLGSFFSASQSYLNELRGRVRNGSFGIFNGNLWLFTLSEQSKGNTRCKS